MELLTPQQIAEILQVSYDTALGFVKYSGVPYIMVGKQYRVKKTSLYAFLDAEEAGNAKSTFAGIYNNHISTPRVKLERRK